MTNEEYYTTHATAAELCAVLGPRWGICRPTPLNQARYGRCITRAEYHAANEEALRRRADAPQGPLPLRDKNT